MLFRLVLMRNSLLTLAGEQTNPISGEAYAQRSLYKLSKLRCVKSQLRAPFSRVLVCAKPGKRVFCGFLTDAGKVRQLCPVWLYDNSARYTQAL